LDPEIPPVELVASDFRNCVWPTALPKPIDVAEHMDRMNDDGRLDFDRGGLPVISFSHFLPRQELLPEKRNLTYPNLSKMVGSTFLDARVKALAPECHVFGHTHFGWDAVHDGVRYVQAPLAYPKERERLMNGPPGWAPFLLWSRAIAAAPAPWAMLSLLPPPHIISGPGTDGSATECAADTGAIGATSAAPKQALAAGASEDTDRADYNQQAAVSHATMMSGGGADTGGGAGSSGVGGGGFVTYPQSTYWSDRARTTVRDPANLKLAPWAEAVWGKPSRSPAV
jgi:hypothetical protein